MTWPIKILEIVKSITSAINENATLILVVITGIYMPILHTKWQR